MTGRPRTYTTLLALVLVGMFAVAILSGEQANASENKQPTDHPSEVTLATYELLESGKNDAVAIMYHALDPAEDHRIRRQMYKAARLHCGSPHIFEDFSCGRYEHG